jgi:hypothetical protein
MNYLQEIAAKIRSRVPAEAVPADDTTTLFLMYAVLLLVRGEDVSREDVHNAWVAWMSSRGGDHESAVPFSELDTETQAEDSVFVVAIRDTARDHARRP